MSRTAGGKGCTGCGEEGPKRAEELGIIPKGTKEPWRVCEWERHMVRSRDGWIPLDQHGGYKRRQRLRPSVGGLTWGPAVLCLALGRVPLFATP